jgi:NAD(P)-dependent dehydrogenase (short-subunit alcohol dehydrogenase family)
LLALLQGLAGEAMAQSLRDAGAVARFNPIDLAHPASIQTFANAVRDQEGALHGLVNNGAIATNVAGMAFEDIEIDLWDKVMGVNAGFVFA